MPELPDVENFKRYLDATGLHQRIENVAVLNAKILHGCSGETLSQALTGHELTGTHRHGKHLFAAIDDGPRLMLHFGMTGRLAYFKDLKDDPEHDRLRLDFANGYHLAYVNQRLFGQAAIVEDLAQFVAEQELGPDAFANDLDEEAFQKLLAGRRGQVKSALMDQSLIAGLGNVYSDEILFKAHLHPKTPVNSLDRNVIAKLYRAMREVLRVSIDSGAGSEELFERLPDDYLLPHREEGDKCPVCDGEVQAIKASGRTAYYCPACQPLEREK